MKRRLSTICLVLVFLIGISLLLYPTLSDYWNSFHQSKTVTDYAEAVAELDPEAYERFRSSAQAYNRTLLEKENRFQMSEAEWEAYEGELNVSGNGIMGYVEIPMLQTSLPIYHGTDDSVLQTAVGHIEGSSLPVGGAGTHCVLSGHRGLPSAKLFTDLDRLVEGDVFMLRVLDETLTYEVDRILIVEPQDVGPLDIEEGKDYCTLVTCTPYGINTHRLLVRGHRIENLDTSEEIRVIADAMQVDTVIVACCIAVPALILLLLLAGWKDRRKSSHK